MKKKIMKTYFEVYEELGLIKQVSQRKRIISDGLSCTKNAN
jgi:hypothetical protein